jgi:exosortase/archaeosortase family protein
MNEEGIVQVTGLIELRRYLWLFVWLGAASALSQALYPQQVAALFSSVAEITVENLGNFYALAALLFVGVFFLLRWRDLQSLLLKEGDLRTLPLVRLTGLVLSLLPLLLVPLLGANEDARSLAVFPIFLVFWGIFLLIYPSTLRMTLPYSAVLLAATLLPSPLTALVGGPLVGVASFFSRLFISATGIPYTYTSLPSPQLQFSSQGGSSLTLVITPFCSSISSISVFLLLVILMHIDLGKDRSSTMKMAIFGTVALVLLNALRIAALVWAGFIGGAELLTGVHGWIGYTIFVAFYAVAAFVYVNNGRPRRTTRSGSSQL